MEIRTFVVRNAGSAGEPVSVSLGCPPFELLEGGGDTTLAPGESLAVRVEFAPRERDSVRCVVDLGSISCGGVALIANASRTWRVRPDGTGDAPTVQAGIDSSEDGDVVLVGPGTYYENINLRGKAIHLLGEKGPEVTVLDGSREDSTVVMCDSGEGQNTVIEGFTITGGRGWTPPWDASSRLGGGVVCFDSTPIIRSNVIRNNEALDGPSGGNSRGGAIGVGTSGSFPPVVIEDNVIADNYCSRNSGGINIAGPCIIQDNVIRGNSTGTGDGGGLYLLGDVGRVIIRRNLIVENYAADHGGGIYIGTFLASADMTEISKNVILRNTAMGRDGGADCSGAGIWIGGGALTTQNTIAFNHAENLGVVPAGGGCCLENSVPGTSVKLTIFYANVGGGLVATEAAEGEEGDNIIFGNSFPGFFVAQGTHINQEGDFRVDPLFCDTTATSVGQLREDSPAFDSIGDVIGALPTPSCAGRDSIPTSGPTGRRQ